MRSWTDISFEGLMSRDMFLAGLMNCPSYLSFSFTRFTIVCYFIPVKILGFFSFLHLVAWRNPCADCEFTYQVLAPCGVNDFVCGKAAEWVSNGTELCHAAGFAIKLSDNAYVGAEEASCYGGRASLDSIADSWKSSQSELAQKAENLGVLEDFLQWMQEMPFSEKVSWAVGGMVLTAGLLFIRWDHSIIHSAFQISDFSSQLLFWFLENEESVKKWYSCYLKIKIPLPRTFLSRTNRSRCEKGHDISGILTVFVFLKFFAVVCCLDFLTFGIKT